MTPGEWLKGWDYFMSHDDPVYVSEHRKSFGIDYEMPDLIRPDSRVTLIAISAARLGAREAVKRLEEQGIACDLFHLLWLKPFVPAPEILESLRRTGMGVVLDDDFEIAGPSRSIAYDLMHATGATVRALGLEDRTCGTAPHLENLAPPPARIVRAVEAMVSAVKP